MQVLCSSHSFPLLLHHPQPHHRAVSSRIDLPLVVVIISHLLRAPSYIRTNNIPLNKVKLMFLPFFFLWRGTFSISWISSSSWVFKMFSHSFPLFLTMENLHILFFSSTLRVFFPSFDITKWEQQPCDDVGMKLETFSCIRAHLTRM